MAKHLVYLVSDDDVIRRALHHRLEKSSGHTMRSYAGLDAAMAAIEEAPDVLVVDVTSLALSPAALFKELRQRSIELPVVLLAQAGDHTTANQAIKLGAADYLEKPLDPVRTELVFRHLFTTAEDRAELSRLRETMMSGVENDAVVAGSREMQLVLRMVERVKDRDIPVLLTGEAGSGRETVARLIHARSKRRNGSYTIFHRASVPADLRAAELFGFEKGAFPGATHRKSGVLTQSDGGTVYLDEIGDFDADLQTRLLHLLRFRVVKAVGSDVGTNVDVRILAGSSQNLREMVREKKFRSDLYYHLASFPVQIPPLRERPTDIVHIAEKYLTRYSAEAGVPVKGFSREALEAMHHYPWPGNVQELAIAMQHAVAQAQGDLIGLQHLPVPIHPFKNATMELETEGKLYHDNKIVPLDRIKEQAVRRAIEIARGNLAQTSRELDISRSTLYKLIEKYGISV
ncbi:MAG: sigma-54 dependent transcriptional regulator [Bacteroidota bacterium]|jgi:two-component system response regulator AtoC|nr:sigma-54 dependent transcriptional regulator [Bacteroidota bacterium]